MNAYPLSRQVGNGAYHTFVIYDHDIVTIELLSGQLVPRDPKDIDHYLALISYFGSHALRADAARSFITDIAEHYRATA